jgi:hypothetical protein
LPESVKESENLLLFTSYFFRSWIRTPEFTFPHYSTETWKKYQLKEWKKLKFSIFFKSLFFLFSEKRKNL